VFSARRAGAGNDRAAARAPPMLPSRHEDETGAFQGRFGPKRGTGAPSAAAHPPGVPKIDFVGTPRPRPSLDRLLPPVQFSGTHGHGARL